MAWATACFALGSTYYELNRPAEARPWLERTAKLQPTADVYRMLGDCLDAGGETTAAIQAARRACELAPDGTRHCEQLIRLLAKSGKSAEVETLRQRLIELIQHRRRVAPTQ